MTSMITELTDGMAAQHNWVALGAAIEQVQRLRSTHEALVAALRWCVSHEGERLADHPEVLARVRAVIERAEGG